MFPVKIKYDKEKNILMINWSDDFQQEIKLADLRFNCPCAICQAQKEEQSKSYIPIYSSEQISIQNMKIIGNYALNIIWKDNHDTGIYDFSYLRKFSEK